MKQLAQSLPSSAWKNVTWRQGVEHALRSRFAAVRLHPAHRDYWQAETHPEEWLLVEWPKEEAVRYYYPENLNRLLPGGSLGQRVRLRCRSR